MNHSLPTETDVDSEGSWSLPTEDEQTVALEGKFLGMSSSGRKRHNPRAFHNDGHAEKGEKCSACRWSEFRVFRDGDGYVIHFAGVSVVPGETLRSRVERRKTAHEVVLLLTTRRPPEIPYMTKAAADVLGQCATYDQALNYAFVNRGAV